MTMHCTAEDLSDDELCRLEAMIAASTPGPWISYVPGRDAYARSTFIELGTCNELGSMDCIEVCGGSVADQDLMANARQYLPRLIAAVRALRTQLESHVPHGSCVEALATVRHAAT